MKLFEAGSSETWRRLRSLPRSAFGTTLAHAGLGLAVIGIVATTAWRSEAILAMKPGETRGHRRLHGRLRWRRASARARTTARRVGLFEVSRDGAPVTELDAVEAGVLGRAERHHRSRHSRRAGAAISTWCSAITLKNGAYSVRLYFNPLVRLIWLGALVMFVGGAVSLSDRRLRVGAPKRAQAKVAAVSAAE